MVGCGIIRVNPAPSGHVYAAALGDSITHGGGAISSSPAFLEYSYTTYLSFECLNLGRSGDTSHTTLERFDQDVLPLHPANLLILTGSNSLRADTPAQEIIKDLDAIRKEVFSTWHPSYFLNTAAAESGTYSAGVSY